MLIANCGKTSRYIHSAILQDKIYQSVKREIPTALVHTRDKKSLYCNMAEECNS